MYVGLELSISCAPYKHRCLQTVNCFRSDETLRSCLETVPKILWKLHTIGRFPHRASILKNNHSFIVTFILTSLWGTANAENKVASAENPGLLCIWAITTSTVLSSRRGSGQNIALCVLTTTRQGVCLSQFCHRSTFLPMLSTHKVLSVSSCDYDFITCDLMIYVSSWSLRLTGVKCRLTN